MDQFELLSNFEDYFQRLSPSICEDESPIEYDRCTECNTLMTVKTNNQYVCATCGLLKENVEVADMSTITSSMNYNTMSNGLRCVGLNAHRYQTILRSQSSNDSSPEIHVRNILFAFNHKIGKEKAIPKFILLNVSEQFKHLRREGTIYRGTILRAILAAMTNNECLRHMLLFRPADIYQWFDIDSQTFSKGEKRVRELLDRGFLMDDIRDIKPEISYIHAYATKIELLDSDIEFLHVLMNFTTDNKLLNPNAKSSTRSLCVLHLFLTATKNPMKPDDLAAMFKCNFGTIRTISLDLFYESKKLIPVFKEHGVPHDGLLAINPKTDKIVKKRRAKTGRIEIKD